MSLFTPLVAVVLFGIALWFSHRADRVLQPALDGRLSWPDAYKGMFCRVAQAGLSLTASLLNLLDADGTLTKWVWAGMLAVWVYYLYGWVGKFRAIDGAMRTREAEISELNRLLNRSRG